MQQNKDKRIINCIVNPKRRIKEPSAEQINLAKTDAGAFGDIFEEYYSYILNFFYRKTLDINSAKDFTSECFFRVMKNLPKFNFKYKGGFTSWIYKIAVNLFRESLRKNSKKYISVEEVYFLNQPEETSELEEFEKEYDRAGNLRSILKQISKMDTSDQEVIHLHFFEGLSYEQISKVTGNKNATIRSQVSRAVNKLKRLLQQ